MAYPFADGVRVAGRQLRVLWGYDKWNNFFRVGHDGIHERDLCRAVYGPHIGLYETTRVGTFPVLATYETPVSLPSLPFNVSNDPSTTNYAALPPNSQFGYLHSHNTLHYPAAVLESYLPRIAFPGILSSEVVAEDNDYRLLGRPLSAPGSEGLACAIDYGHNTAGTSYIALFYRELYAIKKTVDVLQLPSLAVLQLVRVDGATYTPLVSRIVLSQGVQISSANYDNETNFGASGTEWHARIGFSNNELIANVSLRFVLRVSGQAIDMDDDVLMGVTLPYAMQRGNARLFGAHRATISRNARICGGIQGPLCDELPVEAIAHDELASLSYTNGAIAYPNAVATEYQAASSQRGDWEPSLWAATRYSDASWGMPSGHDYPRGAAGTLGSVIFSLDVHSKDNFATLLSPYPIASQPVECSAYKQHAFTLDKSNTAHHCRRLYKLPQDGVHFGGRVITGIDVRLRPRIENANNVTVRPRGYSEYAEDPDQPFPIPATTYAPGEIIDHAQWYSQVYSTRLIDGTLEYTEPYGEFELAQFSRAGIPSAAGMYAVTSVAANVDLNAQWGTIRTPTDTMSYTVSGSATVTGHLYASLVPHLLAGGTYERPATTPMNGLYGDYTVEEQRSVSTVRPDAPRGRPAVRQFHTATNPPLKTLALQIWWNGEVSADYSRLVTRTAEQSGLTAPTTSVFEQYQSPTQPLVGVVQHSGRFQSQPFYYCLSASELANALDGGWVPLSRWVDDQPAVRSLSYATSYFYVYDPATRSLVAVSTRIVFDIRLRFEGS